MQLICALQMDPEQYVAERFHERMQPPNECPHCHHSKTLWALGYYCRNLSRLGFGALLLMIRRFRCCYCGKTVSLLPWFAQPYRFVQNRTIESYFRGELFNDEVSRHSDLLSQYWKRFRWWLPGLERALGHDLGRGPPSDPNAAWRSLMEIHSDLGSATQTLVTVFQITPFGRYRCHCPNGPEDRLTGG